MRFFLCDYRMFQVYMSFIFRYICLKRLFFERKIMYHVSAEKKTVIKLVAQIN